MKPEDRSRLDAIRDWVRLDDGADAETAGLLLRIIDEQAAEIAEAYKTLGVEQAARAFENRARDRQLAEERAKREAAENLFQRTHGVHHSWVAGYERERAKRETAEYDLRTLDDAITSAQARADKAERKLAKAHASLQIERRTRDEYAAQRDAQLERAEKAEARVVELETCLADGGAMHNEYVRTTTRQLTELQALVDAATEASEFWRRMWNRAMCGCFAADCRKHGAYASEDVDRSRDLAAKEKEPK